ncbi:MAG TPA: discoidin domain-containing protein [Fimbriimonadaceae bacterium]|nr:discoidin domain-containing protein [Fimbriimonadaceae bacterium]
MLSVLACAAACSILQIPDNAISLAGSWRFELDRRDAGLGQKWFERTLPDPIQLPGAIQNQGVGDPVTPDTPWTGAVGDSVWRTNPKYARYRQPGHVTIPFFLQPQRHYVGPAWFQRDIDVPDAWAGKRIELSLERPHWTTQVWVDGRFIGSGESLSTPDEFDLGTSLAAGRHSLTIRVDNRLLVDVGALAHSVTDHTQGNWNGIVGKIELKATSPVWIEDVQAYPDVAHRRVRLVAQIGNDTGKGGAGTVWFGSKAVPVSWTSTGATAEATLDLPWHPRPAHGFQDRPGLESAGLWDEFSPAMSHVLVRLTGDSADDEREVSFGLREIGTDGRSFTISGRKMFLRGTLECCIFPLTGYPPTDVESWRRIIRICKSYGLNSIRFHSWCPPEAAFEAADELGFFFSVEVAAWTRLGDGAPVDAWLYREAARILRAYGNHPSFILMPYGNEPNGPKMDSWLSSWVEHWRETDPRRLYTSASGWPMLADNQYDVSPGARGPSGWLGGDYASAVAGRSVPYVVHEMGQWCAYPYLAEISKYTGPLKNTSFEIARDSLADHGMLDEWPAFLKASGKLQLLCYKEEVEAALRTPGIGGFQLLDLHDYPGQGTALVGVLDPFWDGKGYATAAEFRRFCGPIVPLVRLTRRTFTTAEKLTCDMEIANFGATPLHGARVYWKLVDGRGVNLFGSESSPQEIPIGRDTSAGHVQVSFASLPAPRRYRLIVGIAGTSIANDWNVWVYPSETSDGIPSRGKVANKFAHSKGAPCAVKIVHVFDQAARADLERGETVLLETTRLPRQNPKGSFTPVFWNRIWFPSQACTTLGLLCDPGHPALKLFPTEINSDWQWAPICANSRCVDMDGMPKTLRPIVGWIDDWNTNRRLGLIFECRAGRGRLLVCAADLDGSLSGRQLRASLLAYLAGPSFRPATRVSLDVLTRALGFKPTALQSLGARVLSVDSEDTAHGNVAANAIDGDPDTIWHTKWDPTPDPMPHTLVLDLGRVVSLRGITYLPRQDMSNGRIASAQIWCAAKPGEWVLAASPKWPDSDRLQTVLFAKPVAARYVKVVALSEVRGNPFASIADLDVLLGRPR